MSKTENDVQDDLSNGISTQRIQNQYIWRRARMETELTFSIVLGKLAPSIFFFFLNCAVLNNLYLICIPKEGKED